MSSAEKTAARRTHRPAGRFSVHHLLHVLWTPCSRPPPRRRLLRNLAAANQPPDHYTEEPPREQPDKAAFLAILLAATLHPPVTHEHAGDPPEDGEQHRH